MSLELLLYAINVAENFNVMLTAAWALGSVVLAACLFICAVENMWDEWRFGLKTLAIAVAVLSVPVGLLPSQKTMYAMLAVTLTKEAAATDIGQSILMAADKWAKDLLKDGK